MNSYSFIGNLTRDPELRTLPATDNGAARSVCNFSVAINEKYGDKTYTSYVNVAAWGKLGETCAKYLAKGRKVSVSGRPSARAYTGNDGAMKASLDVSAATVEFLSARPASETTAAPNYDAAPTPAVMEADDGILPF